MQPWWSSSDSQPQDVNALHTLGLGFMATRTLTVALDLRLFTHLAGKTASLSEIAHSLGLAERPTKRLLSACAALGLVQVSGQHFRNTPLASKYLVEGQATYIGSYLQMFDALGYHRWEQLHTALHRNAPLDGIDHPYHDLANDADAARAFLSAQHHGSQSLGQALARRFDFQPFHCLLDLGAGAGTYTIEILRHYPQLRAIVVDFPEVCRIAAETIHQAGLASRVRIVAGDYEHDPLPQGADIVLWSGNLHASSPARCTQVLRAIASVLAPIGTLLIHDYLLDDTHTGPLIPALLALHLMLVSQDGQVYSGAELGALLEDAGFTDIRLQPFLSGHSSLVSARLQKAVPAPI